MAKLYITEYAGQTRDLNGQVVPVGDEPSLAEQTPVAISGSAAVSAAFGTKTRFVRIHTDAICSVAFGAAPTATVNSKRLAADQTEYFGVQPGQKVAVTPNT